MNRLERELKTSGFSTCNFGHRSMIDPMEQSGERLYEKVKNCGADTVCFVTHSMGALVVRAMYLYLSEGESFPLVERMVLIAPPNQGAANASRHISHKGLLWLLGPNIERMKTGPDSYAAQLPVPKEVEIGVIAGIKGDGKGYNRRIEGENDGMLTPENASLGVEKEMLLVKKPHTALVLDRDVARITVRFLKEGSFSANGLLNDGSYLGR
ncbi:MAG TPA: hypothetical protein PLK12_08165 [Prolixibacteraceae bacterium]|nr:hypothetical protein [Prolixibacteraceae bacterium]